MDKLELSCVADERYAATLGKSSADSRKVANDLATLIYPISGSRYIPERTENSNGLGWKWGMTANGYVVSFCNDEMSWN